MGFVKFNPNPAGARVGDCAIRAIAKATNSDWERAYSALSVQGYALADMPSANHVWGAYLRDRGFARKFLPDEMLETYTVNDFCSDHPDGVYVLALSGHVVTVIDGDFYDTWDSGDEVIIYYFERKENR